MPGRKKRDQRGVGCSAPRGVGKDCIQHSLFKSILRCTMFFNIMVNPDPSDPSMIKSHRQRVAAPHRNEHQRHHRLPERPALRTTLRQVACLQATPGPRFGFRPPAAGDVRVLEKGLLRVTPWMFRKGVPQVSPVWPPVVPSEILSAFGHI